VEPSTQYPPPLVSKDAKVITIALSSPAEHMHFSDSIRSIIGLISSLGNIRPLVMPVIFGLLIDLTGTFYASVFSVAALSGIIVILSSSVGGMNRLSKLTSFPTFTPLT